MNNWWHDLVHELGMNDELGTGELLDNFARAIESEGFDDVYDDIMNRLDDEFQPGDPLHGIRASRRGRPAPNLRLKDIDPFGPRFTANPGSLVIIPGEQQVACTPMAITLINSRRSCWQGSLMGMNWERHDNRTSESVRQAEWHRWVMMRMKAHVISCERVLKKMIVVTDHWDAQTFEQEHARELAAWSRRGMRFVFLLVTRPRCLSPLRVKF